MNISECDVIMRSPYLFTGISFEDVHMPQLVNVPTTDENLVNVYCVNILGNYVCLVIQEPSVVEYRANMCARFN